MRPAAPLPHCFTAGRVDGFDGGVGSVSFQDTEVNGVFWQARGKPSPRRGAGAGVQCRRPQGGTHGPRERTPLLKTTDLLQLTTLRNR